MAFRSGRLLQLLVRTLFVFEVFLEEMSYLNIEEQRPQGRPDD